MTKDAFGKFWSVLCDEIHFLLDEKNDSPSMHIWKTKNISNFKENSLPKRDSIIVYSDCFATLKFYILYTSAL